MLRSRRELVERHGREKYRKIDERREEQPAGVGGATAPRQTDRGPEERDAEHQRHDEVSDAGESYHAREERDGEEDETAGHRLEPGPPEVAVAHGQHADSGAGVVAAVQASDRERVGELPEEHD